MQKRDKAGVAHYPGWSMAGVEVALRGPQDRGFRARDDGYGSGALVMVSFPKPEHGSGFPARVVAIVP